MPDVAAQLTKCQDNEILDHLRWHIAQGRTPSSIEGDPAHSVVVVRFADGELHGFENTSQAPFTYLSVTSPPINFSYAYKSGA